MSETRQTGSDTAKLWKAVKVVCPDRDLVGYILETPAGPWWKPRPDARHDHIKRRMQETAGLTDATVKIEPHALDGFPLWGVCRRHGLCAANAEQALEKYTGATRRRISNTLVAERV